MRVVIEVLIILFLFFGDPFGLKTATQSESVEIYSRLFASFYRGSGTGERKVDIGQDQIAVALVTDKAAEELDPRGYPLPLPVHGRIIKDILCSGARAVFVDVNFRWERVQHDAKQFLRLLRMRPVDGVCRELSDDELRQPNVAPVILGHIPSTTSACDPLSLATQPDCQARPGFNDLRHLNDITDVVTLPEPKGDLRYVLEEGARGETGRVSPALRLLNEVCRGPGDKPTICAGSEELRNETMTLRWGWLTSPRNGELKEWLKQACGAQQAASLSERFELFLRNLSGFVRPLYKWLNDRDLDDAGYCPYHDTLQANDIYDAAVYGQDTPPGGHWTGKEILESFFAGRVVFYGIDITGVGDVVNSPTLQRLPGVYAHAMALDNLITEGRSYWREPGGDFLNLNHSAWIDLLLSLSFLLFGWAVEERNDRSFSATVLRRPPEASSLRLQFAWQVFDLNCAFLVRIQRPVIGAIRRFHTLTRCLLGIPRRIPLEGEPAYWEHWRRKWLFVEITILIVGAVMVFEGWVLNWPPNDWIVLVAIITLSKPPHRKFDEWTGTKHPAWRHVRGRWIRIRDWISTRSCHG